MKLSEVKEEKMDIMVIQHRRVTYWSRNGGDGNREEEDEEIEPKMVDLSHGFSWAISLFPSSSL